MAECKICEIIKGKKLKKIYEDSKLVVALSPEPVSLGHLWIVPKTHYTIMEQIPDYEFGHFGNIANKFSIILFEALKAHGTNIFIQNGIAAGQKYNHFFINLIPRGLGDKINLNWESKQLTEEQMSTIELKIKENVKSVGIFETEKQKPIEEKKPDKISSSEENYLIRSLRRIP